MTAQGTVLHQCPSKALLSGPKAARPQRIAQRVIAQAQPSRSAQQSRPNTAVQAAAVAEAPTHTSRVSEKQMGDGPTLVNGQVLHSLSKERLELVNSLEGYVSERVLPLLKPVDKCWQPADFLPDPSQGDYLDQLAELRKRTDCLPDDYFVVLVGDMVTEEALPTYMAMLNTLDGVRDETGAEKSPWGKWTREWTAEENRHGDLMNKYCMLSGRVNMKAVEVTIQNLIGSGMDPKTENNPYLGFIYTSFQERATKISHGATARHAKDYGDKVLGQITGAIASDEARHESAYSRIVDELFRKDPSGTTLAFADMMKKQIVMPAHMMDDMVHKGRTGRNIFQDFSTVAESTGTYTAQDYASILEHLISRWELEGMAGLSSEAQEAQEYVCKLPPRIRRLADRTLMRKEKSQKREVPFSWIYDRTINMHI